MQAMHIAIQITVIAVGPAECILKLFQMKGRDIAIMRQWACSRIKKVQ